MGDIEHVMESIDFDAIEKAIRENQEKRERERIEQAELLKQAQTKKSVSHSPVVSYAEYDEDSVDGWSRAYDDNTTDGGDGDGDGEWGELEKPWWEKPSTNDETVDNDAIRKLETRIENIENKLDDVCANLQIIIDMLEKIDTAKKN